MEPQNICHLIAKDKVAEQHIFCHYFATNKKNSYYSLMACNEIPNFVPSLIAKDKVAEQHILGKYSNCNSFGVTKVYSTVRFLK